MKLWKILDVEILSMKEAGTRLDIVEDGTTFEENAVIKALLSVKHSAMILYWRMIRTGD